MQIDQRVQDVANVLDTPRHRFTDMDFAGISDAVARAAHAALPRRWQPRKEPARWPFVAGALILATVAAGFFFILLPAMRVRPIDDAPDAPTVDDPAVAGEPLAQIATAFQEQPDGQEAF